MTPEFRAKIAEILGDRTLYPWQEAIIDAVMAEYEFTCKSFVYAGPGHQSKHECTNQRPHAIEGEHYDDLYEWIGTARFEGGNVCPNCGERELINRRCQDHFPQGRISGKLVNAPHEGYNCPGCRIPSELRA